MITSTQTHYAGQQGWNDCLPSTFLSAKKSGSTKKHQAVLPPPSAPGFSATSSSKHAPPGPMIPKASAPPPPPPSMTASTPPPPPPSMAASAPPSLSSTSSVSSFNSVDPIKTMESPTSNLGLEKNVEPPTSTGVKTSSNGETGVDTDGKLSTSDEEHSDVFSKSVVSDLEHLLTIPSDLPSREFSHYKVRLEKNIPELTHEHLVAVSSCLGHIFAKDSTTAEERKVNAREVIVQHTMNHVAISTWAIPLRKIIEKVQLEN